MRPVFLLLTTLAFTSLQAQEPTDRTLTGADRPRADSTVKAGQQVYTWTDEQGVVHYGTHPPVGREGRPVDLEQQPVTTIKE